MNELMKYLKSKRSFKLTYIEKTYLTDEIKALLKQYNLTLQEFCHRLKYDIPLDKEFICKYCGKKLQFDYIHNKYHEFCGNKCSLTYRNKSQEFKDKVVKICLERYGVEHYCQSEQHLKIINEKIDQTVEKMKQKNMELYGFDSFSKTPMFKAKQKANEKQRISKQKATCVKNFGVDSFSKTPMFRECIKEQHDEIQEKIKQTCLKTLGVDRPTKSPKVKEKIKQTCLKNWGETTNLKTPETKEKIKKTNEIKYGFDNPSKSLKVQAKIYETKKANNSFNKSSFEEQVYILLLTKFSKDDIKRQFRSKDYPFACDFYIKSLDLYIECNGMWTHGWYENECLGSFDSTNQKHIEVLNIWKEKGKKSKFFRNAVYCWTELDVRKLEAFKKNNLNYKIFWTLEEVKDWINSLT
jgi:hypothetical protein